VRRAEFTPLLWIYAAVYLSLVALAVVPGVAFRLRAWVFVTLGYTNAVASFARLGLMGSGRLYLLTLPVFALLLIGTQAGALTTAASLLIYGFFVLFVHLGRSTSMLPAAVPALDLEYWTEAGISLAVFLVCLVLLVQRFCALQACTLQAERRASADLEQANACLEAYSRTLEARVAERTADLARANARFVRELALAAQIQAGFLPRGLPPLPGWQLAATLVPATEMSGDFYDVFALPDGRLAFLVADVVDKGVGAALCMVLTWALMRTYATEHPECPDLVLSAVNRRLLADTQSEQFVTLFFGVLEPASGELVYCNAGHHPPLLLGTHAADEVVRLARTGLPLGVSDAALWESKRVCLGFEDVLVLYTDGVTDALSDSEATFGQEHLIASVRASFGRSAQEMQDALLGEIQALTGDAPRADDIALMVLYRTDQAETSLV
jgi:serine phosphatase RsbU (regulator of sigma subunit)